MLRPKFSSLALLLVVSLGALACDLLAATARKPTVIIISPPSGSQFREGEDVVLQSTSTDSTGIVRVELVVDGATARTDSAPSPQGQRSFPLIQKWKAIQGDHTIAVRAYNAAGAVSDPAAISVSVSPAAVAGTANPTKPPTLAASTPPWPTDQPKTLLGPSPARPTAPTPQTSSPPQPIPGRKMNCEETASLFLGDRPTPGKVAAPHPDLGTVGRWVDLGPTGAGPAGQFHQALAYSPLAEKPALYAALGRNLYRWDEAAQRWDFLPLQTIVGTIAVDPTRPEIVYAGSVDRVYKSVDGGKAWIESRLGQDPAAVAAADKRVSSCWTVVALDVSRTNPTTVYAGTFNGLFKSMDGGKNWVLLTEGIQTIGFIVWSVGVHPLDDRIVYAGVEDQSQARPGTPASQSHVPRLFRSTDAGTTWIELEVKGFWIPLDIQSDPQNDQGIYLATEGRGIWKSTDGGTRWMNLGMGAAKDWAVSALVIDPTNPRVLYLGRVWDDPGGIYRTDDGGKTWTELNEGLRGRWVDALAISPDGRVLYATVSEVRSTPSEGWKFLSSGVFRRLLR